jgi:signal transduction histidine kinase
MGHLADHSPSLGDLMLRALDYLSRERSFTLAVLSPDLVVVEVTEKFREFQGDPGLIWELVGSEAGLMEILEGKVDIFSLENINRNLEDGSAMFLSLKALPLTKDNPKEGLLLILEDTTLTSTLEQELVQDRNELRLTKNSLSMANEELLKLNRLKSLFLSIAAHDLRSPLTAMLGYTDLAVKSLPVDAGPEIGEYLSIVRSLVDTQSRLISDFLDLDILEQGKLSVHPEPCQLNTIVLEVVDVMKAIARRKQIRIETRLADDLPAMHADPDRIRQILFNLLGNAIKYTNEGDQVEVETESDEKLVRFIVSDHGPGVPESDLPLLFDLYHRTEEARQSRTKGLGLGLFIVKSLVDLHHGQISVVSELGRGTKFKVGIPLDQAAPGGKV